MAIVVCLKELVQLAVVWQNRVGIVCGNFSKLPKFSKLPTPPPKKKAPFTERGLGDR